MICSTHITFIYELARFRIGIFTVLQKLCQDKHKLKSRGKISSLINLLNYQDSCEMLTRSTHKQLKLFETYFLESILAADRFGAHQSSQQQLIFSSSRESSFDQNSCNFPFFSHSIFASLSNIAFHLNTWRSVHRPTFPE